MKKFLLLFAMAGMLVACGAEKKAEKEAEKMAEDARNKAGEIYSNAQATANDMAENF